MIGYVLLNYFFFVFHTLLVLFNTLGWIWKRTRRLNLLTLLLTSFSWFGMGIWYGWGYCLCTDWHWRVRQALGYHDTCRTYIQLMLLEITGKVYPVGIVEAITLTGFLISLVGSLVLNARDFRHRTTHKPSDNTAAL